MKVEQVEQIVYDKLLRQDGLFSDMFGLLMWGKMSTLTAIRPSKFWELAEKRVGASRMRDRRYLARHAFFSKPLA